MIRQRFTRDDDDDGTSVRRWNEVVDDNGGLSRAYLKQAGKGVRDALPPSSE